MRFHFVHPLFAHALGAKSTMYNMCTTQVLAIARFRILLVMLDLHRSARKTGIGDACSYFNERGAIGGFQTWGSLSWYSYLL
jgi:hypothetical protein